MYISVKVTYIVRTTPRYFFKNTIARSPRHVVVAQLSDILRYMRGNSQGAERNCC